MSNVFNIFRKLIFWGAIIFLSIAIYSLTIAQNVPIEFADWRVMHNYYNIVFGGVPMAILLTLFGTIKKRGSILGNVVICFITVFMVFLSYMILIGMMFSIGFGAWINESILYQKTTDQTITINEQIFDVGALGYGGKRIVKLEPFMRYWNTITLVDTSSIDKSKWSVTNNEGDIKFP